MEGGLKFQWDARKRLSNIKKHGIAFEDAIKVFEDPKAFIFPSRVPTGEERSVIVGRIGSRTVAIVYVRRDETYRIISARRARKNERAKYGR